MPFQKEILQHELSFIKLWRFHSGSNKCPIHRKGFVWCWDLIKLPSQSAVRRKSLGNQTSLDPVLIEVILTLWEVLCESKNTSAQPSLSDKLHCSSASIAVVKAEEGISRYFYHLAISSCIFPPMRSVWAEFPPLSTSSHLFLCE